MLHTTHYSNLHAASLDPEQHERTCGYWYTVTSGAMAHKAFATRAGLDRWLSERGLKLKRDLPEQGEWGSSRVIGSYRQCSHMDPDEFAKIRPLIVTAQMNNGAYTLGLIDETDGVRTVHYLNPNVKTRLIFDHESTQKVMR